MRVLQSILVLLFFFYDSETYSQFGIYVLNENNDSSGYYRLKNFTETSNHYFYTGCQYVGNSENTQAGKLLLLDDKMEIQSESLFGNFNINNIHIPVILPDKSIRLYATTMNKGRFNPAIINIDKDFNNVDEKNIVTNQSVYIGDIVIVDEENIIVAQAILDESNTYNITIFQFNTKSNEQIWSSRLINETNEIPTNIVLMKDRSIVVLAKRYDHSFSSFSPIIYRLSTVGEKVWTKDMTSSNYGFYNHDIIHSDNNNLVYTCSYQGRNNEIPRTYILEINSTNGSTILKQKIDSIKANGIIQLSNNNYLIYGSLSDEYNNLERSIASYTIINSKLSQVYSYSLLTQNFIDEQMQNRTKNSDLEGSEIFTGVKLQNKDIIMGGYISLPKKEVNNGIEFYNIILKTNSEGFLPIKQNN